MSAVGSRLLLVGVLVPVALLGGPAAADGPEYTYTLSVSADGEHWESESTEVVLGGRERLWLPGQRRSALFYVRNDSPRAADLEVRLRPGPAGSLIAAGEVTFRSRTGRGGWSGSAGDSLAKVTGLSPGTAVPVVVEAALATSARPRAGTADVVFDVDLRGEVAPLQPATTRDLPRQWQFWAALGVASIGAAGTVMGRRGRS